MARAFAEAAVYNGELTDALCEEVVQRLRSFGAQECLIFLEGLAQLQAGLPEELQRDDKTTIAAIVGHIVRTLGSLAGSDLVRLFHFLVLLDHYDPKVTLLPLKPFFVFLLSGVLPGHFLYRFWLEIPTPGTFKIRLSPAKYGKKQLSAEVVL